MSEVLPLFFNPGAGSAALVRKQLGDDPRVRLEATAPGDLKGALETLRDAAAPRALVCGGDGTLALAAGILAGSHTALAVIPGGTLNHFARRLGLPLDLPAALDVALQGEPHTVGVGYVNDRLFLNTGAVGAYVAFVRSRDFLERRRGYVLATLLAGFRRLLRLRSIAIALNGETLHTPLVFVGVGERALEFPYLGQPRPGGGDGLHLIAVKTHGALQTLALACTAMLRGLDPLAREKQVESHILQGFELSYRRRGHPLTIALDGEMVHATTPLHYRYQAGGLSVVVPASGDQSSR
ncbi:MAG TPA: diacylglycerol kinase family protein [Spongiibacteraceae bacterium]|jgi:diacylglycerol kinase family enzyme|nr:diacylglycerol kinase family protein [Spongiibacteraceae bacterium]HUH39071.1 diacylglycerol kinase family protein [Spongiibacteraceae bacterium]